MKMNYFVVGTNDIEKATKFYDSLFTSDGVVRMNSTERMSYWSNGDFVFAVALPFDGAKATNGNGTMVGFATNSHEDVVRIHRRILELGGTCDGEPTARGPVFSAYARDLDNNKLCIYC